MNYVIKNVKLITSQKVINNAYIEIYGNIIHDFGELKNQKFECEMYDGNQMRLFPGFIDCHTHGGYGIDFEMCDTKKYEIFANNLLTEGVTSFLFTSVTTEFEKCLKNLKEVSNFIDFQNENANINQSECIGIHLEGPFISKEKKGAHKEQYLMNPDKELIQKMIDESNNNIKIVTYSIENDANCDFGIFLKSKNIIGSIGHCNVDSLFYENYVKVIKIDHVTHLYNAMSGLENRRAGVAASSLNDKNSLCELIVDNIHVEKELVKLAYIAKTYKNICLITDSMSAKGLCNGKYTLGELVVEKNDDKCVLENSDVLAGSVAKYNKCVANMQKITDCSDVEILHMTSKNIAVQLNLDNSIGDIRKGMKADLVLVDDNFNVIWTIKNGNINFYEK